MRNVVVFASALAMSATGALSSETTMGGGGFDLQAALERGHELYSEIAICATCHGMEGEGSIGPALNVDGVMPTDILYQLQTNPQMAGIDELMAPITPEDLIALSVYIRDLSGMETDAGAQEELRFSALGAMKGLQAVETFNLSAREKAIQEIETWQSVLDGWERKAKEGPIKHTYEMKLVEKFEPAEPKFTPEPGKTYWYENTGITTSLFGPADGPKGADSSQVVVGDAETKEVIASYKLPRHLRGEVHTTAATPDGKHLYIIGALPEGGAQEKISLETPATLMKVDALTLQPVESYDIGGRIHHAQLFRDKYMLVDTFARNPDGLDVFLMDPDTNEILGGVRDEDLGGTTYTSWTDNESIYILMQPSGYAPSAISGYRAGMMYYSGDLVAMRPFWVAKLNPDTWEVEAEYPYPGYRGNWITIDSSSEFMYVPAGAGSIVSKISLETGEKVWSSATGIGPYGATLNADETQLWVSDKGEMAGMFGRTVTVLNAETGRHIDTLFSAYQVDHILLSPNGKEMWATSNGEGKIYVWDAETRELLNKIDMPEDGDAHGLVWVHYDEEGNSRTVRDQGNFHNGIHPAKGMPLTN